MRPESPGCHEESEAQMVKVKLLTLSAKPHRLQQIVVSVARPTITFATNWSETCTTLDVSVVNTN